MADITTGARDGAPEETDADTRVVGVFEGERLDDPAVQELVDSGEAKPALRKVVVNHEEQRGGGRSRVLVAGLGKREDFDAEKARVAASAVATKARDLGAKSLSWALPAEGAEGGLVEGTLLSLYEFDRFKSKKGGEEDDGNGNGGLESLEIAGEGVEPKAVARAATTARAVNRARDLQNLPSNVATPTFLAGRAEEIA